MDRAGESGCNALTLIWIDTSLLECKQIEGINGGEFGIVDDRMLHIGPGQPTIFTEFVDA